MGVTPYEIHDNAELDTLPESTVVVLGPNGKFEDGNSTALAIQKLNGQWYSTTTDYAIDTSWIGRGQGGHDGSFPALVVFELQ